MLSQSAVTVAVVVACVGCSSGNAKQSPPASEVPKPRPPNASVGPLFFDPIGADFTLWINHFKTEAYHNWIMPQPALMGKRGHVDIEFTVERDGSLSQCRILTSSTNPVLDNSAKNTLTESKFLPLPSDYGPKRITMRAAFFYNEEPSLTHPK